MCASAAPEYRGATLFFPFVVQEEDLKLLHSTLLVEHFLDQKDAAKKIRQSAESELSKLVEIAKVLCFTRVYSEFLVMCGSFPKLLGSCNFVVLQDLTSFWGNAIQLVTNQVPWIENCHQVYARISMNLVCVATETPHRHLDNEKFYLYSLDGCVVAAHMWMVSGTP